MEKQPSICFFEPSPSMEEFLTTDTTEHFYQPSLDMDFLLHGISTIPFYERMEMPKELFSEKEIEEMDKTAKKFEESYRLKCSERQKDEMNDKTPEKSAHVATDNQTNLSENDSYEHFLKYFYKNKEIPKLDDINECSYSAPPENSDDFAQGATNVNQKRNEKFEQFFKDLDDGLYDSVIVSKKFPLSSSVPEEEEDSQVTNQATKLSAQIQFPPSASSYRRDIEEIFRETAAYFENVPEPNPKNFPLSSDEEEKKERIRSKKEIKNKRGNNSGQPLVNRTKKVVANKATQYEEMPATSSSGPGVPLKSTASAGELSKNDANASKYEVSEKVLKASSDTALKTLSTSHVNLPKKDVQSASETLQKKITPGVSKSTDTLKSAPQASVSKSKSVSNLKKDKTKEGKISDKNKEGNSDDEEDWESMAVKSLISKQSKIKKSSKKKN